MQHAALAGRLAEQFGNAEFEPVQSDTQMMDLVYHHDLGWQQIDENPPVNPETGLPYSLEQTPPQVSLPTINRSPELNELRGPMQGLLASMHMWGIYNGRFGLVQKMDLQKFPDPAQLQRRLEQELERQQRLTAAGQGQAWLKQPPLMRNYKLLQFFDLLSLYFNRKPAGERGELDLLEVPATVDKAVTVAVTELSRGEYQFDPFPFASQGVKVSCEGRYLIKNRDAGTVTGQALMASAPVTAQVYTLVGAVAGG